MSKPWCRLGVLAALLLGLGGCNSQVAVEGHLVTGKVVIKGKGEGDSRLEGGKVIFRSESDAKVVAAGSIDEDGTFTATSYTDGRANGVPAGNYKVRLEPPLDDDGKRVHRVVHPKYQDFDKSGFRVTVPLTGELVLEVDRTGAGVTVPAVLPASARPCD